MRIKRIFAIVLVVVLAISLFSGCKQQNKDWKIGIVTGTVAQNEEEFRAAQNVKKAFDDKYGEGRVILQTYPQKFMDEQETVISNIAGIAADPDVKAIIICQGVPGTSAAIDKIKETRNDLLIIAGTVGEEPTMISQRADVIFQMDDLGMGSEMPKQAKKQGAKTFVHYSFPRHMSYPVLAKRREMLIDNCKKLGIKFVDATAPDPTGDAGVSGSQQFILEDVPKKINEYGEDTAFFSTNCAMQVPLIKAVFDGHAIYPQPCCPSPYHGFPSALQVSVPDDKKGDCDYMIDQIRNILAEKDMTGRMSTWPVPMNMMFIEAGADYAVRWIEGDFTDKLDMEQIKKSFNDYVSKFGDLEMKFSIYEETDKDGKVKQFDNYIMILSDYIDL